MDWDLKSVLKSKSSVKKGRRSNADGNSKKDDSLGSPVTTEENKDSILTSEFDMLSIDGPQRSRKIGGWAEETQKSGKNRNSTNIIEQERFQQLNSTEIQEDEIPTIPDFDEIQDDLLLNDIAPSHSISVKMAATYKALNSDMTKLGNLASLEDVDLSLLTKGLQNESTDEGDEPWYWEELFTSVSAEINASKSSGNAISPFLH
ncbi:hypothetical protein DMENIID0001_035870 [Sergentomyia squamirostris]